jgi:hypothetical protein
MKKLTIGKVNPPKPWKFPMMEQQIISKLTFEEMDYLLGQGIFSQADIICELLKRVKIKE